MAGLQELGTTFNLPNYVGTLFALTPSSTPLLSAIGALSGGGDAIDNKIFEWQGYDLRSPANPGVLEGADAPTGQLRVRHHYQNVAQIFQSAVELSYTVQAATGRRSGLPGASGIDDEFDWQVEQELKALKLDMEFTMMSATAFVNPATNAAARKMAGIFSTKTGTAPTAQTGAIDSTHVFDHATPGTARALTKLIINNALQQVWEDGGITEEETATLIVSPGVKRKLTDLYLGTAAGGAQYVENARNIGGVALDTIITDFGRLNIMMSRHVPNAGATKHEVGIFSLEQIKPKFLLIPNKGFLFVEPLAKTGAKDKVQIYGEVGLELGSPLAHGKIISIDPAL
jgi:hypothetical protein